MHQKQENIERLNSLIDDKGTAIKDMKEEIFIQEKQQELAKKDLDIKKDIESKTVT